MTNSRNERYTDMDDTAWKVMLNREMGIHAQGMSYIGIAQRADELGVNDAMIEMLREPERTRFRRVRRGEFPYSQEDIQAMPAELRTHIVFCFNAWQDAKASPTGIAGYETRNATAEMVGAIADEPWYGR